MILFCSFKNTIVTVSILFSIVNTQYPILFASKDAKTTIHLTVDKLLSIHNDKDSICVSATYQEFDAIKGWNTGKVKKTNNLFISKDDLLGVLLPTPAIIPTPMDISFPRHHNYYDVKKKYLIGGYSLNFEKNQKTNHILELGISKVIDSGGKEIVGYTYYLSNDFIFNSEKFSIGPKIGGNIYFLGIVLGCNIVYYTDFHDNTLHWVPFGGFGLGAGKLFFSGNVPFYNKNYQYANKFSVGLTFPIYNISRKEIR